HVLVAVNPPQGRVPRYVEFLSNHRGRRSPRDHRLYPRSLVVIPFALRRRWWRDFGHGKIPSWHTLFGYWLLWTAVRDRAEHVRPQTMDRDAGKLFDLMATPVRAQSPLEYRLCRDVKVTCNFCTASSPCDGL